MAKGSIVFDFEAGLSNSWKKTINSMGTDMQKIGKALNTNLNIKSNSQKKIDILRAKIEKLKKTTDYMTSLGSDTRSGEGNATLARLEKNMQYFADRIDVAKKKLDELRIKIKQVENTPVPAVGETYLTEPQKSSILKKAKTTEFTNSDEIAEAEKKLTEYKKSLASARRQRTLLEKKENGKGSEEWIKKNVEVNHYKEQVANAYQALQNLRKLENIMAESDTGDLIKTKSAENRAKLINKLEVELAKLKTQEAEVTKEQNLATTNLKINQQAYQEYGNRIKESFDKAKAAIEVETQTMNEATQRNQQIIENYKQSLKDSIATAIPNAFKKFASTVVKTLGKVVGVVAKSSTKVLGLQKVVRTLVQYGFGFRSLYYLVNNFKSALADGLEYISKATGSADAGVATMAKEMETLLKTVKELVYYFKSAGAAMVQPFMPLITTIIPKLVAWFNKLSITVATFVAQLTGQSSIIVASTNLEDYANALDETASSAKEATKALGAYDKLNVISQDTASGSSDSSIDTSKWFTSQNVDANPLVEKIKAAWADVWSPENFQGNTEELLQSIRDTWTKIGNELAIQAKAKLDDFSNTLVNDVIPFMERLATAIASLLNGFNLASGIGASIGTAIGNIFNTVITFLSTLVSEFDWKAFGQMVLESLVSFLKTLDAESLGKGVNDFVTGVLDAIITLLKDPEFSTTLGETFSEFISEIDVDVIVADIAQIFILIFTNAIGVLVGWAKENPLSFSVYLALFAGAGIVKLLASPIATVLKNSITKAAEQTILKPAEEALTNKLTETMGNAIKNSQGSISADFAGGLALTLGGGITALTSFIQMWNNGWTTIGQIVMTIGAVIAGVGVALLAGASLVLGGVIGLIVAAVAGIVILIKEHWDEICEWWDGVKKVISEWWDNLKQGWSDFWDSVGEKWTKFKEDFSQAWSNYWGGIKDKIVEIWEGIKQRWTDFWDGITQKWTDFKTAFSDGWNNFWGGIKQVWNDFWDGLKQKAKDIVNSIIGVLNGMLSGLATGLNAAIKAINKISVKIPSWVPIWGGKNFSLNLQEVTTKQIPYLAQGAVIPPNKEFMAVLGDQKQGTNIEAPLETIKQALAETLSAYAGTTNNQPIVLQLDGKTVAKVVWDENKKRYKQTGKAYSY